MGSDGATVGSSRASTSRPPNQIGNPVDMKVPSTVDEIVSLIKSFDSMRNEQEDHDSFSASKIIILPILHNVLRDKKGKGHKLFTESLQGGGDPLTLLNPQRHALGYTFILGARCIEATDPIHAEPLVALIDQYARAVSSPDIDGAADAVSILLEGIVNVGKLVNDSVGCLPSMLRIFDAFRQLRNVNNLTTLHPIILLQCLRTAHYQMAYDWVLQYDIVEANSQLSPLTYTTALEYFYYGGWICAKIEKLERACELFEKCISMPSQSVSCIQIDAYKKLILVQLLKDGKVSEELPLSVSPAVNRSIRGRISSIGTYLSLAESYSSDVDFSLLSQPKNKVHEAGVNCQLSLQRTIDKGSADFERDHNVGLVKLVEKHFLRHRVQRLASFVCKIPLREVLAILGVEVDGSSSDEALAHIVDILADINKSGPFKVILLNAEGQEMQEAKIEHVVYFHRRVQECSDMHSVQHLTSLMEENKRWTNLVADKERSIAKSEPYLTKLHSSRDRFSVAGFEDEDEAF